MTARELNALLELLAETPDAPPAPDRDDSCEICLGAGGFCTVCEQSPLFCACPEPHWARCGAYQGTGRQ